VKPTLFQVYVDAPTAVAALPLRVAIVHEWFVTVGGSENVVAELPQVFPQATVFAVVDFFDDAQRAANLGGRRAKTTFIQRLPFARRNHRLYLPLMPLA
jgi:hypothetical protein